MKYSDDVRNAGLDARVDAIGPAPTLKIFAAELHEIDAKEPAALATITLPNEWMTKAKGGSIMKKGVWAGTASARGKAKSFRICAKDKAHIQGGIPADMVMDNADLVEGQAVAAHGFVITAGNG